ncbi:MAG: hypothetical protein HY896_01295 [Deltaproteobacteria bacterium]|nr:hypothetical protein [Deltaproteobacteria bacterium]
MEIASLAPREEPLTAKVSRHLLRKFLIPVSAVSVACLVLATQFDPRVNPHSLFAKSDQCGKCHVYHRGNLEPERFVPECSDYCLGCHADQSLERTHPIKVRPGGKYWKMKIPAEFRLDDEGRVMCLTCHKAHGPFLATVKAHPTQKPEPMVPPAGLAGYYRTFFLRVSDPVRGFAALCDRCHKKL